jgi:hypothetical protein
MTIDQSACPVGELERGRAPAPELCIVTWYPVEAQGTKCSFKEELPAEPFIEPRIRRQIPGEVPRRERHPQRKPTESGNCSRPLIHAFVYHGQ